MSGYFKLGTAEGGERGRNLKATARQLRMVDMEWSQHTQTKDCSN